jgi:type VI secretion system protein ImpL
MRDALQDVLQEITQSITGSLSYSLGAVVLLLGLVALGVFFLARRAMVGDTPLDTESETGFVGRLVRDARTARSAPASLRRSFASALAQLRRASPGKGARYRLPWVLMLGQARAGKSTLLARSGLELPYGEPWPAPRAARADCSWWFFQQALVLDVLGDLVLRRDGRTSDNEAWKAFLQLLERSRRGRPADGIVLAIPASEVFDVANVGADLLTEGAHRAEILYRKLREVQTALSMRLPVYVVITQGDLLPGFPAFLEALPGGDPRLDRQMAGWSSPDSPDTVYSGTWPDRVFDSFEASLNESLVEVLGGAARVDTARSEEAFLLARSVRALREPLRVYLNQIFAPSAYHEPFPLRGLYLAGGKFDADSADIPDTVAFAREMLADKAFPEAPVGRPTEAAVAARKRARWALAGASAALILVSTFGLPAARDRVAADAGRVVPLLDTIYRDVSSSRSDDGRDDAVRRLMRQAREIPAYQPRAVLLPSSWLSPLHGDVVRGVAKGYGRITLPALRTALDDELTGLSQTPSPPPRDYDPEPTFYHRTREFSQFQRFLGGLGTVERRVESYDCLARTCTQSGKDLYAALNGLLQHVYGEALAPPTRTALGFYEKVARRLEAPGVVYPPDGDDFKLGDRAQLLASAFHERIFEYNALMNDLDALVLELNGLAARSSTNDDVESYRQLLELINQTEKDLAQPELAFLGRPVLALGDPYNRSLAIVQSADYLGPRIAQAIRADGTNGFRQARLELAAFSTPYTGPFLAQEGGQVVLKLGSGLLQLRQAIQGLLDQTFLDPGAVRQIVRTPPDGTVLLWQPALLQQAQSLEAPYQEFLANGLALFSPRLAARVELVARSGLEASMIQTTRDAQRFEPRPQGSVPSVLQESLRPQVSNFQTSAPQLATLLDTYIRLNLVRGSTDFAAAIGNQQNDLLEQMDKALAAADLYAPKDPEFRAWDGNPVLAFSAFGVGSSDALGDYLAGQRQQVTTLAVDFARPVLGAAVVPQTGQLAARWRSVVAEVDAYTNKTANNPLQTLEDFVNKNLQAVILPTCPEQIPAEDPPGSAGSYFLTRRAALRRGVRDRCQVLTAVEGRDAYLKLARIFKDRLAGRFPFSSDEGGLVLAEASPAALQAFFEEYDRSRPLIENIPEGSSALEGKDREVRDFLKNMEKVRTFLAPFLEKPDDYPVPTYAFQVDFRVNRTNERGANEIFRWSLTTGEKTVSLGDKEPTGTWSLGIPVTLGLDWASDSPQVPVSVQDSDNVAVRGRSVSYEYRNLWALIRFLRDNPTVPTDFRDPRERRPESLRLNVQVRNQDPPGSPIEETRSFVRVTLLRPDDPKKQVYLPYFPPGAPVLGEL